jgi:ABC-type multidrug transport system fused ATPase/permease subunit
MHRMERKLDVGATLRQVFQTYGEQAGVLLPVAFCLYLIVAVVTALLAGSFALFPLVFAVGVVAATLYQGMVVGLVRDVQDGRRDSSVGELVSATWPVVLPLIGAGLLSGIAIGIGMFLLVIPGLILLTIWAVIAPVIVVEHKGVIAAFGRSRELVRGNGWQVFGVIFTVFVITAVVSFVLAIIGAAIAGGVGMRIVANLISSSITAPIGALAAATIYFGLLSAKAEPSTQPVEASPDLPPPLTG